MPLVEDKCVLFFLLHSLVVFVADVLDELIEDRLLVTLESEVFLDFSVD